MDSPEGLILWILAGAGITLLYAAYKGKSPLAVVTEHVSGTATPNVGTPAGLAGGNDVGGGGLDKYRATSYDSHGMPYSVGIDDTGTQYVYDGNGSPISVLPANYSTTPSTYIPVEGTYDV